MSRPVLLIAAAASGVGIVVIAFVVLTQAWAFTNSGLLVIATSALALGSLWSVYASFRLARASEEGTRVLVIPAVAIRRVHRVKSSSRTVHVHIANVGVGTAKSAYVTVKWPDTTIEYPVVGKRWMIGTAGMKRAKFDIPQEVNTVDVSVDCLDLLNNAHHNEILRREIAVLKDE